MKEQLIERLKKSEEALTLFSEYRRDMSNSQADRNAVAFAELFELMAFTAIHELIPEYIPTRNTQIQVAQALGGTRNYVTVKDGKVEISKDYHTFLANAENLKNKKNG